MRQILLLLIVPLLFPVISYGQYNLKENNVWIFGGYSGLDFNSGTPVPIHSAFDQFEAAASVSDANGQLLFYSSGDTIWNRNHKAMPDGYNLMVMDVDTNSAASATQGTLILPVINNPDQYYVFSLDATEGWPGISGGRLFYSIVDMTLDGGLGDIVPGWKSIKLDSNQTEKMTAVAGDDCNIWLLTHHMSTIDPVIKAFEITAKGINTTPVKSQVGNLSGLVPYATGAMVVAPNRRKIAICSTIGFVDGDKGFEIYDFDPATGIASNAILLDTGILYYGAAFSPDNSKLYAQQRVSLTSDSNTLVQYDISLSTPADIIASKTIIYAADGGVAGGMGVGQLKLGPDGKIYIASGVSNTLSVVNSPNAAGTACQFSYANLQLLKDTYVDAGLPGEFVKPLQDTVYFRADTTITNGMDLTLAIPGQYFTYLWNNNSTDTAITVTAAGTYWVTYSNYCTYRTDTFVVADITSISGINYKTPSVTAYPNPANQQIIIELRDITRPEGSVEIIDALGRSVMKQPYTQSGQGINISSLTNGIYLLQYTDNADPLLKLKTKIIISK